MRSKIDNRRVSVMSRLVLTFIGTSCLLWLACVLYLVILPSFFESSAEPYHNSDVDQHLLKRLEEAIAEVNTLRQQSDSIQQAFDVLQKQCPQLMDNRNFFPRPRVTAPEQNNDGRTQQQRRISPSHELIYQRLHLELTELGFAIRGVFEGLLKEEKQDDAHQAIAKAYQRLKRQHQLKENNIFRIYVLDFYNLNIISRKLITQSLKLGEADDRLQLRSARLRHLGNAVQEQLGRLQNPEKCHVARKLTCTLNKSCGFGCQMHHVTFCLIVSYYTNRTMILRGDQWSYSSRGWTSVFKPLSETCTEAEDVPPSMFTAEGDLKKSFLVDAPIVDIIFDKEQYPYLPLSFPKELADELLQVHSYPPVWWIGQFVRYLMRFVDSVKLDLDEKLETYGFRHPIVGIHVRRTDKLLSEASFHSVKEYMEEVENWYDVQMLHNDSFLPADGKRAVYVATDEPTVFDDLKREYPNYLFIGSYEVAKSATAQKRYTDASLHGIIADVHFLSLCDFLVCTFSSQVCRLAYELMQTRGDDMAYAFRSLDDVYYFGGQHPHDVTALMDHKPEGPDEIELKIGDRIGIAGNHWNGYSKGVNRRTQKSGLYPSYKVEEAWNLAETPYDWSEILK
ncbi:Alpha-(1,6)-fucosyltransferase [Trichinella murrelli]|uniref:Alpha-(1,6)-fucosyltransferase n=1 Tax=Trichinella murrelli TaxID=144512 RepID=A0A0V0TYV8_9BILA|nr:Alpha-(1,6)-fucosyltransferase [Trichinella murrelli]